MAETVSRTSLGLVVLALCLLLALLTPVASQSGENSTAVTEEREENSTEDSHHEEVEDKCEEEEVEFDSTVRIARFEFHRVETIFIILVFIMVVVLAKMGKYSS